MSAQALWQQIWFKCLAFILIQKNRVMRKAIAHYRVSCRSLSDSKTSREKYAEACLCTQNPQVLPICVSVVCSAPKNSKLRTNTITYKKSSLKAEEVSNCRQRQDAGKPLQIQVYFCDRFIQTVVTLHQCSLQHS